MKAGLENEKVSFNARKILEARREYARYSRMPLGRLIVGASG